MDMDETLSLLNAEIAWARAHSPFYAELPEKPLASLAEYAAFPFTTAQDIAERGKEMLCCSPAKVRRLVTLQTSGTTGRPKRLAFSDRDLEDTVGFFCRGMRLLCGAGDTVGVFLPGRNPDGLCDLLSRGIDRFGGVPKVFGPIADFAAAAQFCRETRPFILIGTPAQMRRLALTAPDLRPRRVLLSADYVSPAVLHTIERALQCEVFVHYGLTESGLGCAVETPARDGLHIRRGILLETLPDGEIVLTTLLREAMPLLRYRTGDIGRLLPNGNLGAVSGRRDALAGRLSVNALDDRLFSLDGVLDYAASLNGDELTVRVCGDAADAAALLRGAFPALQVRVIADDGVCADGVAKRRLEMTEK